MGSSVTPAARRARESLETMFAANVLEAIEILVSERVVAELDARSDEEETPWLSIRSAASYVGLSERTLERELARGRLRSSRVGRRRLLHRDDLDAYVKDGGGGEAPATPPRRQGGV